MRQWDYGAACIHVLFVIVTTFSGVEAVGTALQVAYLFPTSLLDLGYSYQYNIARLEAKRQLEPLLQSRNVSVTHHVVMDVNMMTPLAFEELLSTLIVAKNCSLIFLLSSNFISGKLATMTRAQLSQKYYGVRFVEYNLNTLLNGNTVENILGVGYEVQAAFFVAGAVAGAECDPTKVNRSVCMLMPNTQYSAANAFYRGMKFGRQYHPNQNTTTTACSLTVINQNTFSNAVSEVEIVDLFVQRRGCSTVIVWSNNRDGALRIQEHYKGVFSITWASDGTLVIGDSVLTSVMADGKNVFYNATRDWLDNVPANQTYYLMRATSSPISVLGSISPRAPKHVTTASRAAEAYLESNAVICAPVYDQLGSLRIATGCLTINEMSLAMPYLEKDIVSLPDYVPSATCSPGTFVQRAFNFSLQCLQCPMGSVSSTNGSLSCTLCGVGFTSAPSRIYCIPLDDSTSLNVAAIAAPSASLGFLLVAIVAGWAAVSLYTHNLLWFCSKSAVEQAVNELVPPPMGPQVALAMISTDSLRSDPMWRRNLQCVSAVYESLYDVVVPLCVAHNVHIAINIGDTYVLVHADAEALFYCVSNILLTYRQRNAAARQTAATDSGVAVSELHPLIELRCLCHYSNVTATPLKSGRTQYSGEGIHLFKYLWGKMTTLSEGFAVTLPVMQRVAELREKNCATVRSSSGATPAFVIGAESVHIDASPQLLRLLSLPRMTKELGDQLHMTSLRVVTDLSVAGALPTAHTGDRLAGSQSGSNSQSALAISSNLFIRADASITSENSQSSAVEKMAFIHFKAAPIAPIKQEREPEQGAQPHLPQEEGVISMASFLHFSKLAAVLLGKLMQVVDTSQRLDMLMFASARLHLDIHPQIVLPTIPTTTFSGAVKEPLAPFDAIPSMTGFSRRVTVTGGELQPTASQKKNTLTQQVAKNALKLIAAQIVLSMDELRLSEWLKDMQSLKELADDESEAVART